LGHILVQKSQKSVAGRLDNSAPADDSFLTAPAEAICFFLDF